MPRHTHYDLCSLSHSCFRMMATDACKEIELSSTSMKKICRQFNIQRWPYRKLKSLYSRKEKIEESLTTNTDLSLYLRLRLNEQIAQIDDEILKIKSFSTYCDNSASSECDTSNEVGSPTSPPPSNQKATTAASTRYIPYQYSETSPQIVHPQGPPQYVPHHYSVTNNPPSYVTKYHPYSRTATLPSPPSYTEKPIHIEHVRRNSPSPPPYSSIYSDPIVARNATTSSRNVLQDPSNPLPSFNSFVTGLRYPPSTSTNPDLRSGPKQVTSSVNNNTQSNNKPNKSMYFTF